MTDPTRHTTPEMARLVKRLRAFAAWYVSCAGGNVPPEAADADEAADAIEALTARSEKAEAEREDWKNEALAFREMWNAALARVAEAKAEGMREAAEIADDHVYGRDIDWWRTATKAEISADACRSVASAIRATALTAAPDTARQEDGHE